MIYTTRTLALVVAPEGQPVYAETATRVEIVSEGAGEFVEITQQDRKPGVVAIGPEEWPALRKAIDKLIGECANDE